METTPLNSDISPGAILKRCREYHGITLHAAADATKIGVNYLKALEEDKLSEFSSLAYLKGFLRIYSNHLGLNPDDMIRLYEKLYEPSAGEQVETPAAETAAEKPKFSMQRLVLPAILLILMIIAATFYNRMSSAPLRPQQQPVVQPAPPAPVQPRLSSIQPAAPVKPEQPEPLQQPRPEKAGPKTATEKPVPQKQPAEKGFILRMKVAQNGSLSVSIDGAPSQSYDLNVGDVIEWKADKNIALELSNAGGVEAELDGRPLRSLGSAGKSAYVVIDAEGIKQ